MPTTKHAPLALALLILAVASPARAEDRPGPNSSTFRYVDEKRPARVYPIPPPDADPTGLSMDELRERSTMLEERVERLERER